jgi:hypothetical protein
VKTNIIAILLLCSLSIISCKKKVADIIVKQEINDQIFTAENQNCITEQKPGIDSKVGRIICEDNTFTYDYGWYGNEGPMSMMENFRNTFKAYHYQSFFTHVGMDKKILKIMIPRSNIEDVMPRYDCKEDLMFECDNCNAVAKINFENKVFYFPYQENKVLVADAEKYEFHHLDKDGYFYKIYSSLADNNECGLVAKALNPNIQDKLSISCNQINSRHQAVNYLTSVRMSKTISKK